jgi:hypothetical protein
MVGLPGQGPPFDSRFEAWLAASAGISRELMESLQQDNDWAFIIKMHGVMEAGLNHLIRSKLTEPELASVIAHLETNNDKRGKLAFVKAYGLLSTHGISFVRVMSDLRNRAVHDVKNFNLNLDKYVDSFNQTQRTNWINAMLWWAGAELEKLDNNIRDLAIILPRESIYDGCMFMLMQGFAESTLPQRLLDALKERAKPDQSNPKK